MKCKVKNGDFLEYVKNNKPIMKNILVKASHRIFNHNLIQKIINTSMRKKTLPKWCILLVDVFIAFFSIFISYVIGHGFSTTINQFPEIIGTFLLFIIFFCIGFLTMRIYRSIIRYSTFIDLYNVFMANFIAFVLMEICRCILGEEKISLSSKDIIMTFIVSTLLISYIRVSAKFVYNRLSKKCSNTIKNVFVYGVKSGGTTIAKSITAENPRRFIIKGFISDANDMIGHMFMGVKIYKNDDKIVDIMRENNAETLVVSYHKINALANNNNMTDKLISAGIHILISQNTKQWDGKSNISLINLRNVNIEDLLPRDEIQVDIDSLKQMLKSTSIFITGSAGSIGSEIVRQISEFGPKNLVLVDEAETPQHDIRVMMERDFPNIKTETIVSSITKHRRMENLFNVYRPDYVFHAAAYKHVPMMEDNPSEAVQNNIDGTRVIADLAVKYGVKKFVMISTDKAVNPTNVMGCSKRICEIYVQALDKAIKDKKIEGITQFVTTRFGNVLGSNGSVIPLFKEQIANGGPVTVTHPEITRFFMLIPEACKLVLEAGVMGKGGEIFVFDMGKPVKIVDLATKIIQLSGAKNVKIKFTGLREGEKLYEEVLNIAEKTKPTFNDKIKIAQVRQYEYEKIKSQIDKLFDLSYLYNDIETVRQMKEIVPEYKPNNSIYECLDKKE